MPARSRRLTGVWSGLRGEGVRGRGPEKPGGSEGKGRGPKRQGVRKCPEIAGKPEKSTFRATPLPDPGKGPSGPWRRCGEGSRDPLGWGPGGPRPEGTAQAGLGRRPPTVGGRPRP